MAGAETAVLPRSQDAQGIQRILGARPVIVLDLEASAKEISEARIIEIAAVKIHPDGSRETFQTLVSPGFDISEEITELTGISNSDLETAMPFEHYAGSLLEFFSGCDLAGYNIRNYDAPLLWESFYRAGIQWTIGQREILDVMEIFFRFEPRSLDGACRFYLGRDHVGAHRAMPDVEATLAVLDAQLRKYKGLPDDTADLIQETKRDRRIDMAGSIILNDEDIPVFGFGKHKGVACQSQRGYLRWMMGQDFSPNTKMIVDALLDTGGKSPE